MKNAVAIYHVAFEDAGILEPVLDERGVGLTYLQAGRDDLSPALDADLVLVLGGPISIYEFDRYPFLKGELQTIEAVVKKGIPVVGICLGAQALAAVRHAFDDEESLQEAYHARGWTDGLPIVAPTPERVEAFLAAAALPADAVLGEVPTREVRVTAEHAAINAVMAGCRPEYFPVVVAAVRAHLHEKANCHSTTGTLSGAAQIVLVNGPIRHAIGIESGICSA